MKTHHLNAVKLVEVTDTKNTLLLLIWSTLVEGTCQTTSMTMAT